MYWLGSSSADDLRRLGKDWRPLQSLTLAPSMDPPLPAPAEPQRSDRQARTALNPLCLFTKTPPTALHTRAVCRPPHPCMVTCLAVLGDIRSIAQAQPPPLIVYSSSHREDTLLHQILRQVLNPKTVMLPGRCPPQLDLGCILAGNTSVFTNRPRTAGRRRGRTRTATRGRTAAGTCPSRRRRGTRPRGGASPCPTRPAFFRSRCQLTRISAATTRSDRSC